MTDPDDAIEQAIGRALGAFETYMKAKRAFVSALDDAEGALDRAEAEAPRPPSGINQEAFARALAEDPVPHRPDPGERES